MYIRLFSSEQEKPLYGFRIVDEDTNNIVFDSSQQFFLIPSVRSAYKTGREAYAAARTIAKKRLYHIDALESVRYAYEELTKPVHVEDVSSEDMLFNHYMELVNLINARAKGSKGDKEDHEMAFEEFKMVRTEMKTVIKSITETEDKIKMQKILARLEKVRRKHFKEFKDEPEPPEMPAMPPMPGAEGQAPPGMPPMPMAAVKKEHPMVKASLLKGLDKEAKTELINEYGKDACKAIEVHHKGAFYDVEEDDRGATINIFEIKGDKYSGLLRMRVNDRMNVEAIIPSKNIQDIYPFHSVEFYQKYWKPIVEKVGHFSLSDFPIIILSSSLPDIPSENKSFNLTGWNVNEKKEMNVDLSFKGKDATWMFEPQSRSTRLSFKTQEVSRYTEEDYFNAMVECIDQKLVSLLGHTGRVIQVMADSIPLEFDIDFGRGLDVVRLTEPQFKIVA